MTGRYRLYAHSTPSQGIRRGGAVPQNRGCVACTHFGVSRRESRYPCGALRRTGKFGGISRNLESVRAREGNPFPSCRWNAPRVLRIWWATCGGWAALHLRLSSSSSSAILRRSGRNRISRRSPRRRRRRIPLAARHPVRKTPQTARQLLRPAFHGSLPSTFCGR